MNIETFAPIIIPTLNRYEHFRRCVESLARCNYANKTELIIGLDYPPSEKYVCGWKKILEYIPEISGFKKVTVLKAKVNLGAGGNLRVLKEYVWEKYDTYISTEDDNEFSVNFLEYINNGLQKYRDNESVLSICAYSYPVDMTACKTNVFAYHEWSAWGVGRWVDKEVSYTVEDIKKLLFDPKSVLIIYKKEPKLLYSLLNSYKRKVVLGDVVWSTYSILNNKVSIFPKVSKVRNWGQDGSGLNSIKLNKDYFKIQEIDGNLFFDYDEILIRDSNYSSLREYFSIPLKSRMKLILLLAILWIKRK